ncbi:MAG: hypothetical protein ACRDJM_10780 [Actinomycetota bacterium]
MKRKGEGSLFERMTRHFERQLGSGETLEACMLADDAARPWMYWVGLGEALYSSCYLGVTNKRLLVTRVSSWIPLPWPRPKRSSWLLDKVRIDRVTRRRNGDVRIWIRCEGMPWRILNIDSEQRLQADILIARVQSITDTSG